MQSASTSTSNVNEHFSIPRSMFLSSKSPLLGTFRHSPPIAQRMTAGLKTMLWEDHKSPFISQLQVAREQSHKKLIVSALLQRLPFSRFEKDQRDVVDDPTEAPTCIICLASYQDGDEIRTLGCSHCYHKHCIDVWLEGFRQTCPVCCASVSFETSVMVEREELAEPEEQSEVDPEAEPKTELEAEASRDEEPETKEDTSADTEEEIGTTYALNLSDHNEPDPEPQSEPQLEYQLSSEHVDNMCSEESLVSNMLSSDIATNEPHISLPTSLDETALSHPDDAENLVTEEELLVLHTLASNVSDAHSSAPVTATAAHPRLSVVTLLASISRAASPLIDKDGDYFLSIASSAPEVTTQSHSHKSKHTVSATNSQHSDPGSVEIDEYQDAVDTEPVVGNLEECSPGSTDSMSHLLGALLDQVELNQLMPSEDSGELETVTFHDPNPDSDAVTAANMGGVTTSYAGLSRGSGAGAGEADGDARSHCDSSLISGHSDSSWDLVQHSDLLLVAPQNTNTNAIARSNPSTSSVPTPMGRLTIGYHNLLNAQRLAQQRSARGLAEDVRSDDDADSSSDEDEYRYGTR